MLMTVYNGDRWIAQAIQSVLDQSMSDFELLIVDDGSVDSTPRILDDFASRDSRIRVVTQSNQGVAKAANSGLSLAKYDWVARIDADDVALPERLERQLRFVREHPGISVAGCFVDYINERGQTIGRGVSPFTTSEAVEARLRSGRAVYLIHSGVLMRRDVALGVGGYRSQFPLSHDTDLWNRIAEKGHRILVQPEILAQYRLHEAGMTRRSFGRLAWELRWLEMCGRQRRLGRPEPSFNQFRQIERRAPSVQRLNRWRQDMAFVFYKTATVSRARGSALATVLQLALSTLLNPEPAVRNVWAKSIHPALEDSSFGTGAG